MLLPLQTARVSNLLRSMVTTQTINGTQQQLLQIENEISTGKQVTVPSDNPSAAATIAQLQKTLDARTGYTNNINTAQSSLSEVDTTLGNVTDLLTQAQSIASQNVSDTTTANARTAAASVVDSLYSQALSLSNTQYNGTYLFGGDTAGSQPYKETAAGVQYNGTGQTLANTFNDNTNLRFQVSAVSVFGGLSTPVGGTNLAPAVTANTLLSNLGGATGTGVTPGSIVIGNGTTGTTVDLSTADSVGDVVGLINNAAIPGVNASITNAGINLTASGGANLTVTDVAGGTTAASLGIAAPTGAGATVPITGANLDPAVTTFTPLSALNNGSGIDPTGFTISSGGNSKTISLTGLTSVGDLLNAINGSGLGVTASVDSASNGIQVQNTVQGSQLTLSENGGTTASDLGIRTLTPSTPLSELNNGKGVQTATSGNDFSVRTADGSVVNVGLGSAKTIQDVIDAINTASGPKITASFATTGNGIELTDNTAGAGTLTVTPINASTAAAQLGLTQPASGNTINGADTNGISTPGLLGDLKSLRNALANNDTNGITNAAQNLQHDSSQVTTVRGVAGARVQELSSTTDTITSENTATQTLLSSLQDTDLTTAISQFQALQNSLQASLIVTAKAQSLSLMNYL